MTSIQVPQRLSADPLEYIGPDGDSTAGLQAFVNEQPNGTDIDGNWQHFFVNHQVRLADGSGKTLRRITLERQLAYAWRVTGGLCADWLFDCLGGEATMPASTRNPYAFKSPRTGKIPAGAGNGGYAATTEQQGAGYDGQHLKALLSEPWLGVKLPAVLRVLVHGFGWFNLDVTRVSADGKTIWFSQHLPQCPDGTVAWAITTATTKWKPTFLPNPAYAPQTFTGWDGYGSALERAIRENQDWTCVIGAECRGLGIHVISANRNWNNHVAGWELSDPLPTEFQGGIARTDASSITAGCYVTDTYGDGFGGPGLSLWDRATDVGRCCFTAHHPGLRVEGGEFERSKHSVWDIEATKNMPGVKILNNAFGGPHAGAWSSPADDFEYRGNHSTQADIDAGRITSLAAMQGGNGVWSGGGKNVKIKNNDFDIKADPRRTTPAMSINNCQGLEVSGNRKQTFGYFLAAKNSTGVVTDPRNDGGPSCKGQVAP